MFQTGGNWSGGNPPGLTDNAAIDQPGNYTITLQGDAGHKGLFANGAGVNVTFDVNGSEYTPDEISLGGLAGDNVSITFARLEPTGGGGGCGRRAGRPAQAAATRPPRPEPSARLLKAGEGGKATVTIPITTTEARSTLVAASM